MTGVAAVALGLLRRVPLIAWVVLALLAWGGVQQHLAGKRAAQLREREQAEAQARADTIRDALVETTRRAATVEGIANDARQQARRAAADRDAARAAADAALQRLRASAAVRAAGGAADPAAAAGSAPAGAADVVPADVLGRCAARVLDLADAADAARRAGAACERAYDALMPAK